MDGVAGMAAARPAGGCDSAPKVAPEPAPDPPEAKGFGHVTYRTYASEADLDAIMNLVDQELSEPYSVFTYR